MAEGEPGQGKPGLFELLGIRILRAGDGESVLEMEVQAKHFAPNGYLHAGSIVSLADSAAGAGCKASLPDDATSFTTIELKSNFFRTVQQGVVVARGTCLHAGRTTQVWDVNVSARDTGKTLAEFRCTQLIIY